MAIKSGCEGCVVLVVDLNDGEVGVGGQRAGAGMSGQGCDLVFARTKEMGEDVGADLSRALMVLVGDEWKMGCGGVYANEGDFADVRLWLGCGRHCRSSLMLPKLY